ncbi:hypothetical protein TNIN_59051 [Trichonephila inaurata madagascariensis]|uniref:Uncharacterized protein n=1 Tax=Trichonephila inaurata madagascariensis TaxID=2747483 RepID=A0A8X6IL18_9ARAC|nr:hypothetical protein TNIN_59051 [Trichonephila inaurata madagascariensis]
MSLNSFLRYLPQNRSLHITPPKRISIGSESPMVAHRHSCVSRLIGTRFKASCSPFFPFLLSGKRERRNLEEEERRGGGNCRNIRRRKSSASNAWPANCAAS